MNSDESVKLTMKLTVEVTRDWALEWRDAKGEFLIDDLLVSIHLSIEMILVDWSCAMGV